VPVLLHTPFTPLKTLIFKYTVNYFFLLFSLFKFKSRDEAIFKKHSNLLIYIKNLYYFSLLACISFSCFFLFYIFDKDQDCVNYFKQKRSARIVFPRPFFLFDSTRIVCFFMIRSCFILSPIVQPLIFGACAGMEPYLTRDDVRGTSLISLQLWRDDRKCGSSNPLPSGEPAQCNPNHPRGFRCCSAYGWCGKTSDHCHCDGCHDYKLWRTDLKCGSSNPLPSGEPAQCDPFSKNGYTCCSAGGWCGKTSDHCHCNGCHNYRQSCLLDGLDAEWFGFEPLSLESVGSMLFGGDSVTVKCRHGRVNAKDNNLKYVEIVCKDGQWNTTVCVRPLREDYKGCFNHNAGGNTVDNFDDSVVIGINSLKECADFCRKKEKSFYGLTDPDCTDGSKSKEDAVADCHCGVSLPYEQYADSACLVCRDPGGGEEESFQCGKCGWRLSIYLVAPDCRLTLMPDNASIDSWRLLPKTLRQGEAAKIQCMDGYISEKSKQLEIDAVCDERELKIFDKCIKRTDNCAVRLYPVCIQYEEFDGQHPYQSFFSSDASEAVLKDEIAGNSTAESSRTMSIRVEGTDRCELRFTLDHGQTLHIRPSDGIVSLCSLPDPPTGIASPVYNLFFGHQDKLKACVFPRENEQCQFPFTYEGVTYHGCTSMRNKFIQSQCIVNKSTNNWRVCSDATHCEKHRSFLCYTPARFLAVISQYWFSYTNFHDDTEHMVPTECPPGYVQEGDIELKKCLDPNREFSVSGCKKAQCQKPCSLCDKDDPSKCLECDKFYARHPPTGTCVRCAHGYAYCDGEYPDRSLSEKPCGFGLTIQPFDGRCYRCQPGCDSCETQFTCRENGCSKGFTFQEGKCIVCKTGCEDCLSYQPCEKGTCADNFEYLESSKTCYRKGENCVQYGMAEIGRDKRCEKCSPLYQLTEDGKCKEKKCTSDICQKSWDIGNLCTDYVLEDGMKINGTEYVVHKRGLCGSECPISNCAECDSNSKCIHCQAGFALTRDGRCFRFCAPGCKYCFVKGGCKLDLQTPCTHNFSEHNNGCVRNNILYGGIVHKGHHQGVPLITPALTLPAGPTVHTDSLSTDIDFTILIVGITCFASLLLALIVGVTLYMRPGEKRASDGLSSELSDTVLDEILRKNSIVVPTFGHPYARSSGPQLVQSSGGPGPPALLPPTGSSIIDRGTESTAGESETYTSCRPESIAVEFRRPVAGNGIGEAPGTVNVQWPPPEYEDIGPATRSTYESQQGGHAAHGVLLPPPGEGLYPPLPLPTGLYPPSNNDDIRSLAVISDLSSRDISSGHGNTWDYSERQELPVPPSHECAARPRSNRTTQSKSVSSVGVVESV